MKKKAGKKDISSTLQAELEKRAWNTEPPRASGPLAGEDLFVRSALDWGRGWIRRHHKKSGFATHSPVALVLSDHLIVEEEILIASRESKLRPLGTMPYPLAENVFVVTPVVKRAAAVTVATPSKIDAFVGELDKLKFGARALVVIDPANCAIGAHLRDRDLMDICTSEVPLGSEPVLSIDYVDEVVSRHHQSIVKLPKQWVKSNIWRNPADDTSYAAVKSPEHVVHASLWEWLVAVFGDQQVYTDYEVQVASGRADIRITEAHQHRLSCVWLELKVLTEGVGPARRRKSVDECIAQARARHEERPSSTRATFACCYDASKKQESFDGALESSAKKSPEVQLRRYPVLRKLYDVVPSPA